MKRQPPSKTWKKREKQKLQKYGATPNVNSGATWHQKGDGINGTWCIDSKGTDKDTYRVTQKVISKLEKDAKVMGRVPLLLIDFRRFEREVFVFPSYIEVEGSFTLQDSNEITPWSCEVLISVNNTHYQVLSGPIAKTRLSLA